ncbi:transcriptional regulator of acetoin/glycerol metabolism [Rhodococcus sp. SORGH_AS 301]|nr:transcriptional regulator of acetoin/glycerol metabolism [Rhodococcus sp. SORGH_AS_0301]
MTNDRKPVVDTRRARERFLTDQQFDTTVREQISISWERSLSSNVRPDRLELPFVREPDLESPLVVAADPVLRQLAEGLVDEPVSVILTSADGVVLSRLASDDHLVRALDSVDLAPGFSYSERHAGTNGIGTTLETRTPTLVMGHEHYAESLGGLVCAGVPIVHPLSGQVVGVLDLTGWVEDGAPLLVTLAKTATSQIQGRLLAQSSEKQTALLNTYLKACRRFRQAGILALGHDIVLLNKRLREALDPSEQAAVIDHGLDLTARNSPGQHVVTLPSGLTVRLSPYLDGAPADSRSGVFLVHLSVAAESTTPPLEEAISLPGIVGNSPSWRHSCQQIARSVRHGDWVAVAGEAGSGRFSVLRAAATAHVDARTRVFSAAEIESTAESLQSLQFEVEQDGFSLIVTDIDLLSDPVQRVIAELLQGREHAGWVGVTIGFGEDDGRSGALVLPFFRHTVHVPALRHRIDDLHQLVPYILRQMSRGQDLVLAPTAQRQLAKYSWPGNVAQLHQILQEVVQKQRSGVIEVDKLPPVCRASSRRTLTQLEALTRDAIVRALEDNGGNKQAAARALGTSRATIYRKIREYGIDMLATTIVSCETQSTNAKSRPARNGCPTTRYSR